MATDGIEQALVAGDWARAAAMLREAGRWAEAGQVEERMLEFTAAAESYLHAGQPDAALRCGLRAGNRMLEARVMEEVLRDLSPTRLLNVRTLLQQARRADLLARVLEAAGETEAAAHAREQGGDLAGAARLWLSVGNHRQAGRLLEAHLQASPSDTQAMLELGGILCGFARFDGAAAWLRRASFNPELAGASLRRLALCLAEAGHPHGAERVLEELRVSTPSADLASLAALGRTTHGQSTRVARRYLLLSPRAASSLGDSYLAQDELEDRRVQLTLFRPAIAKADALQAFARMARAASAVEVPHLLRVVEVNLPEAFMVTALPRGRSLEEWLEQGDLPPVDATLRAVGRALEALHRRGLFHGALNLTNIHCTHEAEVEVAEVGGGLLAGLRETESAGLQASLSLVAPEVMAGAPAGPAADQYALAGVVYRLVTGVLPQPAHSPRWRAPSQLVAVARSLDEPLTRALSPRPQERFATITQFLDALPPDVGRWSQPPRRRTAPTLAALPSQRFHGTEGSAVTVDGVQWQRAVDTWLGREVALGLARPGALGCLGAFAEAAAGVDPIMELDAARSRCVVEVARPWPAGGTADEMALGLTEVGMALAALHASGWTLGPPHPARLSSSLPVRLHLPGLPLPRPATPQAIKDDWSWLGHQAQAWLNGKWTPPGPGTPIVEHLTQLAVQLRGDRHRHRATGVLSGTGSADELAAFLQASRR